MRRSQYLFKALKLLQTRVIKQEHHFIRKRGLAILKISLTKPTCGIKVWFPYINIGGGSLEINSIFSWSPQYLSMKFYGPEKCLPSPWSSTSPNSTPGLSHYITEGHCWDWLNNTKKNHLRNKNYPWRLPWYPPP